MRALLSLVFIFEAFLVISGFGQDSVFMKEIDTATRANYGNITHTDWFLTYDKLVAESGASGTQISYHYNDKNELMRVVCSGYNDLGQWGKEYYAVNGELAFIYSTQEYFPGKAPPNTPMSWKDLPTNEYRVYRKKGQYEILQKEYEALLKWKK